MTLEQSPVSPAIRGQRRKPTPDRAAPGTADPGGLEVPDTGLLKQFWRFRAYGRRELRPLLFGVLMRFGEMLADMATPWPFALVLDNMLKGVRPRGWTGQIAMLFGPSVIGMLAVAAVTVMLLTMTSGAFDYLGDRLLNSAGERITSGGRVTRTV
jgi:hypothetical protein